MTVIELIARLKELPPDADVQLDCASCGYLTDADDAKLDTGNIVVIS